MLHFPRLRYWSCALMGVAILLCACEWGFAQPPAANGPHDGSPGGREQESRSGEHQNPDIWKALRALVLDTGRNRLDRPLLLNGSAQEIATRLDLLRDGEVDERDLLHMRAYRVREDVEMPELDVNRDGAITLLDWALLDVETTNRRLVIPYAIVFDDGGQVIAVPVGQEVDVAALRDGRVGFKEIPMLQTPDELSRTEDGELVTQPGPKTHSWDPEPLDAPAIRFGPFLLKADPAKCPWNQTKFFPRLEQFGPVAWIDERNSSPGGPTRTDHRLQIDPYFYDTDWQAAGCGETTRTVRLELRKTQGSKLEPRTGAKFEELTGLTMGTEWGAEALKEASPEWSRRIKWTREREEVHGHHAIGFHVTDDVMDHLSDGGTRRSTFAGDIKTDWVAHVIMARRCSRPPCD